MITLERIDDIVVNGGIVVTSDGFRIGSVEQVFLSEESGVPAFVTVRTGLFGMFESFVPLAGATVDGQSVRVAFARSLIRNAPRIESDRGSITAAEENELYRHYGTDAYLQDAASAEPGPTDAGPTDAGPTDAGPPDAVLSSEQQPAKTGTTPPSAPPSALPPHLPPHHHPGFPPLPHEAGHHPPPHLLKHVVEGHRPPPPHDGPPPRPPIR